MATFQFMLDRIRECMDAGVLRRDDPEKVALSIWTMSHGIMSLYLAGSRFIPDAKALDRLRVELNLRLFQGLMAEGSPARSPGQRCKHCSARATRRRPDLKVCMGAQPGPESVTKPTVPAPIIPRPAPFLSSLQSFNPTPSQLSTIVIS